MAFSSPLTFSSTLHMALLLLLIIALATQVEGRPSPHQSDSRVSGFFLSHNITFDFQHFRTYSEQEPPTDDII